MSVSLPFSETTGASLTSSISMTLRADVPSLPSLATMLTFLGPGEGSSSEFRYWRERRAALNSSTVADTPVRRMEDPMASSIVTREVGLGGMKIISSSMPLE